MKALISGSAGQAAYRGSGDSSWELLTVGEERAESANDTDVLFCFRDTSDLSEVECRDKEEARVLLQRAWAKHRSLLLMLLLLEEEEPVELRFEAADCLEDLMDDEIGLHLRYAAFSSPVPSLESLAFARELCEKHRLPKITALLTEVEGCSSFIAEWCAEWDKLPERLFEGGVSKQSFRRLLIRCGANYHFVRAKNPNAAMINVLISEHLKGHVAQARRVVPAWAKPFMDARARSPQSYEPYLPEAVTRQPLSLKKPAERRAAFVRAKNQISNIKQLFSTGERTRALAYTEELVASQAQTSESTHIAMSLCDIAKHLKTLGDFELQLRLTAQAVDCAPDDPWALIQHGDAAKLNGLYPQALDSFSKALAFNGGPLAYCGQAGVLSDVGQFDAALECVSLGQSQFPSDLHIQMVAGDLRRRAGDFDSAGKILDSLELSEGLEREQYTYLCITKANLARDRGDVQGALKVLSAGVTVYSQDAELGTAFADMLRWTHKYSEAVSEYKRALKNHPNKFTAVIGMALAYRDLGLFDRSMELYNGLIATRPGNSAAYVGKADLLRRKGRYLEATELYRYVLNNYRRTGSARIGLAYSLCAMNHFEEACSILRTAGQPATLRDWKGFQAQAIVYLRWGKFDHALDLLELGILRCPWAEVIHNLRVVKAFAQLKFRRPIDAVDEIMGGVSSLGPVAKVIEIQALAVSGKLNRAAAAATKLRPRTQDVKAILEQVAHMYKLNRKSAARSHPRSLLKREEEILLKVA